MPVFAWRSPAAMATSKNHDVRAVEGCDASHVTPLALAAYVTLASINAVWGFDALGIKRRLIVHEFMRWALCFHALEALCRAIGAYVARGCQLRFPEWTFVWECMQGMAHAAGARNCHHLVLSANASAFRRNSDVLGRWLGALSCYLSDTKLEVFEHRGLEHVWLRSKIEHDASSSRTLVLMYYHGGGYTLFCPRFYIPFGNVLLQQAKRQFALAGDEDINAQVILPNDRKFPQHSLATIAADGLAIYNHIVHDRGVDPSNIVLAGDSAGAGLTMETLLKLRDSSSGDFPAGAICACPFFDLLGDHDDRKLSHLSQNMRHAMRKLARSDSDCEREQADTQKLARVAQCDLSGLPSLLLVGAEFDLVADHARAVAKKAAADGVDVTLKEYDKMPHAFFLFPSLVLPRARTAVRDMVAFAIHCFHCHDDHHQARAILYFLYHTLISSKKDIVCPPNGPTTEPLPVAAPVPSALPSGTSIGLCVSVWSVKERERDVIYIMAETTLNNVFWGHSDGHLVLSASGLLWRSRTTESQKKLAKDEIVTMLWTPVGEKNNHIKVYQKGGKYVRFTGLKRADIDQLKQHVETYFDRELVQEKVSSSGGNWGEMKFEGPNLNFRGDNESSVLELPLELVAQCALPGKNEVELQFHEDDTVAGDEETLVEMRVYLPPGDGSDDVITAEAFRDEVLQRANIRSVTGKSIVELEESLGTFLTPRGRYGVEIYANFLRMHGKTFDYKIMYSNINRCFLLELPNGINTAFVISLEEPIRQGKQGYPHLVLQLSKEDVHIDVNLSADEIKKYNGNIHERMSGALPQIVATLFKFIIGKKVYTSGKFKTHSGDRAVKCAVKAQSGHLYPLEKSF
ncbi:TPA: hypothetical protein N0F65_005369, partial [Lagenidium giganteum]